ncbi:MAG TPA: CehA/McbA family metallohydrolase [Prosthecobacter sp.]
MLLTFHQHSFFKLALLCLFIAHSATPLEAATSPVALPPLHDWEKELSELSTAAGSVSLTVPANYHIGRAVSPTTPVVANELVTFAANVITSFGAEPSFYRCWLEVEFRDAKKVLRTVPSPELVGIHPVARLLAVTAAVPEGATSLRVALCAQNKMWASVKNAATVTDVQLLRLAGGKRGALELKTEGPLPKLVGARTARVVVSGAWPDGTACTITTTQGTASPAVLMSGGRATVPIHYPEGAVGAATVTATVLEQKITHRVADPLASTLQIHSIHADAAETPALIQLIRDGTMLPGRYQTSTPGIFMTAPWSIDLAPGTWRLRVLRGPEFRAAEQTLEARSGETLSIDRVALERLVDPRKEGWHAGDADGDVFHGERVYTDVSAGYAAEISQAMGLTWAGVGSWDKPTPKTWGEARAFMRQLSNPRFLFLWTDEKPKSRDGHACFVGLDRPDGDPFGWGWSRAVRPLRNFETLLMLRASGAATFANHPMRSWTTGGKFRSNMYSSLPFDLVACGLLDGYNVNEKPVDLQVWSMLLDHGYRVAATGGADFGLDRPIGPVPGKIRVFCHCPEGLSAKALADAVRRGATVVSTGPVLLADAGGKPPGTMLKAGQTHSIRARAWTRGDESDPLLRLELWSHGKALVSHAIGAGEAQAEHVFSWVPKGDWDWTAVRLVTKKGWAITSAFYAAGPGWQPPQPVQCHVTLSVSGLSPEQQRHAMVEIWDNVPSLATSHKSREQPLLHSATLDVPVSSALVIRAGDKRKDVSLYEATGMPQQVERIASGEGNGAPLLEWRTYEQVLRQCRQAEVKVAF